MWFRCNSRDFNSRWDGNWVELRCKYVHLDGGEIVHGWRLHKYLDTWIHVKQDLDGSDTSIGCRWYTIIMILIEVKCNLIVSHLHTGHSSPHIPKIIVSPPSMHRVTSIHVQKFFNSCCISPPTRSWCWHLTHPSISCLTSIQVKRIAPQLHPSSTFIIYPGLKMCVSTQSRPHPPPPPPPSPPPPPIPPPPLEIWDLDGAEMLFVGPAFGLDLTWIVMRQKCGILDRVAARPGWRWHVNLSVWVDMGRNVGGGENHIVNCIDLRWGLNGCEPRYGWWLKNFWTWMEVRW